VLVAAAPGSGPVDIEARVLGPAGLLVSACGPARATGRGVRFTVAALPLLRGTFDVTATVRDPASGATSDTRRLREAFDVEGPGAGGILQVSWSAAQAWRAPSGAAGLGP
jgi:hypothetical protein